MTTMNDDPTFPLGTERVPGDPLAVFEDRLLRGARLRTAGNAEEQRRGFHVRVEDLMAARGRRGTPRP